MAWWGLQGHATPLCSTSASTTCWSRHPPEGHVPYEINGGVHVTGRERGGSPPHGGVVCVVRTPDDGASVAEMPPI